MSRKKNFIIGSGEKLITQEEIVHSGGNKKLPYSFDEAKERISYQLEEAINEISKLPDSAKPNGETVVSVTLHPRYVAKSYHPNDFFETQNLVPIGSRPTYIKPDKWGTNNIPEDVSLTDIYYLRSSVSNLNHFLHTINELNESELNKSICYFEKISIDSSLDKFQGSIDEDVEKDIVLLECVIHNIQHKNVLNSFFEYLSNLDSGIEYREGKVRSVGELGFIPLATNVKNLEAIGHFGFLRAFRRMPDLRPFRPSVVRSSIGWLSELPSDVLFKNFKAVIFDGGLPPGIELPSYINYIEMDNVGAPLQELVQHGLAVTSAYLFGHINDIDNIQPISNVTHVRVLGENQNSTFHDSIEDMYLYDVVDNIVDYMENEQPDLVNISLGPDCSVDDNEVTYWTAKLDSYAAKNDVLITIAAGNNGDCSRKADLHRVQIPSDGVNIVSVGAADCIGEHWKRAEYSAMGPGRNPGVIKPDILAFGGSCNNRFKVLDFYNGSYVINEQQGTSFAAPLVMRHAAYIKGSFRDEISNMAARAILIHQADMKDYSHEEVGWGKCNDDMNYAITCEDNEVTVLYQDFMSVGKFTRLPLPLEGVNLEGNVSIKCTIISKTSVDPEYAASYTKNGFEVTYRPNMDKYQNERSLHPVSKSFFAQSKPSNLSESQMKMRGAKWECVRKTQKNYRASSLLNPCFDLTSHHRDKGQNEENKHPIEFVCVVTINCEKSVDLYNEVVRNYRGVLNQLIPQQTIQINT